MTIEEFTRFSLPFGQKEKPYLLKSVTPHAVVIECTSNGRKEQVTIQKGSLLQ